jgi:hypothetical protein
LKRKTKTTLLIAIPAAVILLGAGVYGAGRSRYSTHFLPGTYVNGHAASNRTAEEVKKELEDDINDYELAIAERDNLNESLGSTALGISYRDDGGLEKLLKDQDSGLWFRELSGRKNLTVDVKFDVNEDKLKNAVEGLTGFQEEHMKAPVDAALSFDGSTFSVSDGDDGSKLKVDETVEAVRQAVLKKETSIDFDKAGLYETITQPADKNALQAQADQYNGWIAATQTYHLRGKTYTVDSGTIAGWMVKKDDGSYDLDASKAVAFADQMAHDTDTFGLARDFKTHSGRTIHLAGGGDYGWAMDEDRTGAAMIEAIKTGQANGDAQAVYQYSAEDRGENDIGGTYVEVNISQQKMWCYKDGRQIVETDVVTGNEAAGMATPSGSVWAIDAKKSPAHFKTTNVDVTYWMPFNGGCGIHNASWRSSFGGQIFKTDGSHGCVNTPLDASKTIYETMEIGYPVVVYYSEDQPVGPMPTREVTGG